MSWKVCDLVCDQNVQLQRKILMGLTYFKGVKTTECPTLFLYDLQGLHRHRKDRKWENSCLPATHAAPHQGPAAPHAGGRPHWTHHGPHSRAGAADQQGVTMCVC